MTGEESPRGPHTRRMSSDEILQAIRTGEAPDSPQPEPETAAPAAAFGPYELFEKIGEGGMAEVFRARHRDLDRIVALKILRAQLAAPKDLERFQREAAIAARLESPHVVRIYDYGECLGRPYLAMQWIDATTFDDWADRLPGGARGQAAAVVRAILPALRALGLAHRTGIVHRDVKPGNLLVDPEGRVFLTDFGLARPIESQAHLTRTGEILGTPAYFSPEQSSGDSSRIGPRSDVYSAGATLYAIFTGQPPFQHDLLLSLLKLIETREPTPIRTLWPEIPHQLEIIVQKAMEPDPSRRYPDANELAADLERWLHGDPIVARPPSGLELLRRTVRRHRTAFAATAAGLVLLLLLGVLHLSRLETEGEREGTRRKAEQLAEEAHEHLAAGRLREAQEKFESALAIDPQRTDLVQESSRVRREIARRVDRALEVARRALDEGRHDQAREELARVEMLARDRADFRALSRVARDLLGSVHVDAPGGRARLFRIRPDTLELEADPILEGTVPTAWNAVRTGAYCLEIVHPGHVPLRIPIVVRTPSEVAPGAHHVRIAVPALPRTDAVPPGMAVVWGGECRLGGEAVGGLPLRTVTVAGFLIDVCEVTNAEFAEYVRATGATPPPHWQGPAPADGIAGLPVTNVSWHEANAYAQWRGKRLPTEDEWERAGRWVDGRPFPWGSEWAEHRSNAGGAGRTARAPRSTVADRSPDGIWDLAGNVSEWTATEHTTAEVPDGRVVRGSAYPMHHRWKFFLLEHLASRKIVQPGVRREYLGFRCAGDLVP